MAGVTYLRQGRVACIEMQLLSGAFDPNIRRELNSALRRYKADRDAWIAVISSEGADFAEADVPDVLAAWLLNLVGAARTFELLWLDRTIDAAEARRIGLVNRLATKGPTKALPAETGRFPMEAMEEAISVPDGHALTAALAFAEELLLYAPVTRNFPKEIAYRSIGVPFHYAQTLELGPNPYASSDRIEGTRAFVENRRPVWQNK